MVRAPPLNGHDFAQPRRRPVFVGARTDRCIVVSGNLMRAASCTSSFPCFFLFLLVQIANFCCGLSALARRQWLVFRPFLAGGRQSTRFSAFKVIHEEFSSDVFRPYHALKDLGTLAVSSGRAW